MKCRPSVRSRKRYLPGLIDDERVDGAVEGVVREEPGGPGEQLYVRPCIRECRIVRGALDGTIVVARLVVALTRLLEPAESQPLVCRGFLHFIEQVVDCLVAGRRHADAATAPHEL